MTEDETSPSEAAPEGATETPTPAETSPAPAPVFDFSGLRGFQSLEAPTPENAEAYQVELVKELVARAERFVQSVDSSIVLASDGVIRWLGDPVGRLVAGEDVLHPRPVLLAHDALPADNREAVERRLGLWVSAHIQKILGPLQGLAAPENAPGGAAEVAEKLVGALGVLSRDDVRKQVKALDQNARAALRKLGVRFGANYVFVPALLKPAARALCLQLWGLKHGAEPDSDKLIAYAAAGRTSFPVDGVLSANAYRIAGFRLCGERVVRVDIVERLTDLIRAAIPDLMRPGGSAASSAAGFVVTQQMTSLTGCAGEAFASILRSLGFESHQVKKSEYDATRRKPEPPKAEAPAVAATAEEAAPVVDDGEGSQGEVSEAEIAAALVESEGEAPMTIEPDESGESLEDAAETETAEAEPDAVEAAAEPEAFEAEAEAPAEAAEAEAEGAAEAVEATPDAESAEVAAPAEAAPAEASDDAEPLAAESAPAGPDEDPLIEVWRPAPRRHEQRDHRQHRHRRQSLPPEGTGKIVWRAREPKPAPQRPAAPPEAGGPEVAATEGAEAAAPGARHGHGQGRGDRRGGPPPFKGPKREDRRDDRPQGDRPPRKEPRPVVVDPDSPFAKLAALRPLLERRDKRT